VPLTETRSPLRRVLEAADGPNGAIPDYDQQYRTIWRAHRMGFLTEGQGYGHCGQLTEAGRAWLAKESHK
jgi:hypothetical protein